MDLNAYQQFNKIDQYGMYQSIIELPEQLLSAYHYAELLPLPSKKEINYVILAGMGGSAIAGDLIQTCYKNTINIPIIVNRDYSLPAWAKGKNCLVILSSHSGNTEEVLSSFECAQKRNCNQIVVSTGGKLIQHAHEANIPAWKYTHNGQPRAAVGWNFGLLTRLLERLDFIPSQKDSIAQSCQAMKEYLEKLGAEIPTAKNPAKRLAGQLVDQYITIFAAEHLSAVARRWKTQVNEIAKAFCQFEILPEANHNTIAGTINPDGLLPKSFSIFLQSQHYHSRNITRMDLTFTEFMVAGIGTDLMRLQGENRMSEMWQTILFGDLMAFYLAILYDVDPTPVEPINSIKAQLG